MMTVSNCMVKLSNLVNTVRDLGVQFSSNLYFYAYARSKTKMKLVVGPVKDGESVSVG